MTIEELTASVEYHLKRLRDLGYTDESLIPALETLLAYYSRAFTLSKQDAQEAVRLLAESHERLRLELESKCQQQEMM